MGCEEALLRAHAEGDDGGGQVAGVVPLLVESLEMLA